MFERVVAEVAGTARNSLDLEAISRRNGWLQRTDPRFVFVVLISSIVVTVLLRNPLSMLVVILFATALAGSSRVPLGWYLERVWLFVPLFTLVILLPSMTGLITPGHRVGGSVEIFGTTIYFTREGLEYALTFTLRVGAAVSLSVLMISTIGWSRLMRALAQLRLPRAFVMVLDMTYRYIHVLLDTVATMFLARRSRMVAKPTAREIRSMGGSAVTSIFSKSLHMSEQVYLAMLARGYAGSPRLLTPFKGHRRDYAFAGSVMAFAAVMVLFDLLAARGLFAGLKDWIGALV